MTFSGPGFESAAERFERGVAEDAIIKELYLEELDRLDAMVEDGGLDATTDGAYLRGGYGDTSYSLDTQPIHQVFPTGNTSIRGNQTGKTDGEYSPA